MSPTKRMSLQPKKLLQKVAQLNTLIPTAVSPLPRDRG